MFFFFDFYFFHSCIDVVSADRFSIALVRVESGSEQSIAVAASKTIDVVLFGFVLDHCASNGSTTKNKKENGKKKNYFERNLTDRLCIFRGHVLRNRLFLFAECKILLP